MNPTTPEARIALIAMPWHDPYMPSIQLGTLKAYVERALPQVRVDTFHHYFRLEEVIGLDRAHIIAQSGGLLGEAVFAHHLFPDKRADIAAFLEVERERLGLRGDDLVRDVVEPVGHALRRCLDEVDWSRYLLVGFSIVFNQIFSSLLMAAGVKERAPGVTIAGGGPNSAGAVGRSLLELFPQLDLVVNGEGERPLTELVQRLLDGRSEELESIPGLLTRDSPQRDTTRVSQMSDLRTLPAPDFRSYFEDLERAVTRPLVLRQVAIPVESSRGCWWDRSHVDPMLACSFCSLNLQWSGYREKGVDHFLAEVRSLLDRYGVKTFLLADNILRHREVEELCEGLRAVAPDLALGIEARVSVKPSQLRLLSRAGVIYIQFGIEALSTGVLEVINKGTTCIQNLQAMKFCRRFGMADFSNIITRHPGVPREAIEETLVNLEYATCYAPLKVSPFSLGYQSPAYKNPAAFGISRIRNSDLLARCVPAELQDRLFWPEKSFDDDGAGETVELWRRVERAVERWEQRYERATREYEVPSLLLSEDGGTALRITDYRFSPPRTYDLDGPSRALYLACDVTRSLDALRAVRPELSPDEVEARLEALRRDHLVFREGRRYLGLAIPADPAARMAFEEPAEARTRRPLPVRAG